MVFTELFDMVEARFSLDLVDAVIERSGTRGSYTSVGNYPDEELVRIVVALSETTGIAVPDLLYAYGEHLFGRFLTLFPGFFSSHDSAAAFLVGLESHVHTEVRKLYATARPPLFTFAAQADGQLVLEYQSNRGLWQFAHGLLHACLTHYGSRHRVGAITDLSDGAGTHVRFVLEPAA
jgi:hypothetical protein